MSKKVTTKSKQERKLQASNAAHTKLQKRAMRKGDEQRQIYHGACIIQQEKVGRILTRGEREKVYDNVIRTLW